MSHKARESATVSASLECERLLGARRGLQGHGRLKSSLEPTMHGANGKEAAAMGLFSKKRDRAHVGPPAGDTNDPFLDGVLDTLASVLRAFGRHSFEIDEGAHDAFVASCEGWARHVLTGARPDAGDKEEGEHGNGSPPASEASPGSARDRAWPEVRLFFRDRRRAEEAFVTGELGKLRFVIWDMIDGLRHLATGGRVAERSIRGSLNTLEQAASSSSLQQLRRAVVDTVGVVTGALEEQRKSFDDQLTTMGRRLASMRTDLLEARRKLELDPLTGIYNRGAFDASIDRYVALAQMTGQPLTLMMFDLDHFKKVNDTHGHPVGDRVLKAVADAAVRSFPRKDDLVARYGGEELAVLLLDAGAGEAPALSARLLDNVRKIAVDHGNTTIGITCSVGVAHLSESDTPATLVASADAALYRAKEKGRDRAELASA